ncbi:MAG: DUF3800 domain-containing protein [Thaumarchaeota archaeon]|nr:DUF3800 domain-containing protein [Nitrososphaerota archaeon]
MRLSLYVDESGDLGFSSKATPYFVVVYVITNSPFYLITKMRRLKKHTKEVGWKGVQEFKFNHDSEKLKRLVINSIMPLDFEAGCVAVDKKHVKPELREQPNVLYNYLTINYMITDVLANYSPDELLFYFDRRYSAERIKDFNKYLNDKLTWMASVRLEKNKPKYSAQHVNSEGMPILQIADYIAGSVSRKLRNLPNSHYSLLGSKIRYKHNWGKIDW